MESLRRVPESSHSVAEASQTRGELSHSVRESSGNGTAFNDTRTESSDNGTASSDSVLESSRTGTESSDSVMVWLELESYKAKSDNGLDLNQRKNRLARRDCPEIPNGIKSPSPPLPGFAAAGGSGGGAMPLNQPGKETQHHWQERSFGRTSRFSRFLHGFADIEHVLEFFAAEETDGMGLGESPGVFIGIARTDNDGPSGGNFPAVFVGGLDVERINDRFLPTAGFKDHGSSRIDDAHAETEFGFKCLARLHPEFPLLHGLRDGLVEMFGGNAADPLKGIRRDGSSFFAAPGLDAREGHRGGKAAALGIADLEAAGTPGDHRDAVKCAPATDAKPDELPGFDPAKERS